MKKIRNSDKGKYVWVAVAGILIVFIAGINFKKKSATVRYKEAQMLMGTFVQIDVCMDPHETESMQAVFEDVWKRLEEISWRMSVYDNESDVSILNRSQAMPVMIPQDLYMLIEDSKVYSSQTNGAFDITIWPLISLWKKAEQRGTLPTRQEIREILEMIGMEHVQLLSDNRVLIKNGISQIDLGGVAKGYAIDEAARILRANNVNRFFIDAGGDVYVGGNNCEDKLWKIGIRDPRDSDKIAAILKVSDRAVATSGDYERNFVIDEKKWSHIINPVTGWPQEDIISATVIAPTAQEADAYATALSVMGADKGNAFIDSLGSAYASMVIKSKGAKRIEKFSSKLLNTYLR